MAVIIGVALGVQLAWADSAAERQARLETHYRLEKPEGNGPFPAVMLVPGCSGFHNPSWKAHFDRVGGRLKEAGFAVIRVDYHAAGQVSTCEVIMNPTEVADDVATAVKFLRAQPFVKTDAINMLAWSYGGAAAFNALSESDGRTPAQVAAVVAYYPLIGLIRPWNVDVPALVLCGASDEIAHCERFEALLAAVPGRGQVKIITYPESMHGFDNSDLPARSMNVGGRPINHNAKTAPASWAEAEKFLRR